MSRKVLAVIFSLVLGLLLLPATSLSATWRFTGSLSAARNFAQAVRLADGKVLMVGGSNYLTVTELYDPASKTWTQTTGSLNTGRRGGHTVTLLNNGKVLVVGGHGPSGSYGVTLKTAELYDPATQTWSYTATTLNEARENHNGHCRSDQRRAIYLHPCN